MNRRTQILVLAIPLVLAACKSEAGPGSEPAATSSSDTTAAAPQSGETSTWAAGDTIPSGRAGVEDIQILEVRGTGDGPVAGEGRRATLAYKAMQADGTVLDPGTQPFTFRVGAGEAIAGWDVVVSKMRVGDDFTILLPQELAYGASRGDLKFDMKLLSVE